MLPAQPPTPGLKPAAGLPAHAAGPTSSWNGRATRPAREAWLAGIATVVLLGCAWQLWKDRAAVVRSPAEPILQPAALARSVMFPKDAPGRPGRFVNGRCPVTPADHIAPPISESNVRVWRGERVALCCDECPALWDEWTDERKDAYVRACQDGREPMAARADAPVDPEP